MLVWEELSPAVVCEVKEGTIWEDGSGVGWEGMGIGKSLCII